MKPSTAILDYGVGNLYSITRAVSRYTDSFMVTDDPEIIAGADRLILPGVGSFEAGMAGIAVRNLEPAIKAFADSGRPMLGICLGAQLLMTRGLEFGIHRGLDIIPGDVVPFSPLPTGVKTPHIGWNRVTIRQTADAGGLMRQTSGGIEMYFVHSYIMKPAYPEHILSITTHGGEEFCSAIGRENVYGTQFHPEKSGPAGLEIISNFIQHTSV